MASIACGNCGGTHYSVDAVRRCHSSETWRCDWHVEDENEDGPFSRACRALAWETPDGWECEAGHAHVSAEHREAQGWDYAEDAEEARRLAKVGVMPMKMDGSGPFTW